MIVSDIQAFALTLVLRDSLRADSSNFQFPLPEREKLLGQIINQQGREAVDLHMAPPPAECEEEPDTPSDPTEASSDSTPAPESDAQAPS